jgi:hypothetical protein
LAFSGVAQVDVTSRRLAAEWATEGFSHGQLASSATGCGCRRRAHGSDSRRRTRPRVACFPPAGIVPWCSVVSWGAQRCGKRDLRS